MTIDADYLALRGLQKQARDEMWHLFSHHPELEDEYNKCTAGWGYGCFGSLKILLDWEPSDEPA